MKRALLLFAVLVCLAGSAFGQAARVDNYALFNNGTFVRVVAGAIVTVCTSAGTGTPCTPLATTYTSVTMVTPTTNTTPGLAAPCAQAPTTNPCTTDANGNFGFWVAPGPTYIVTITGAGLTSTSYTVTSTLTGPGNNVLTGPTAIVATNPGVFTNTNTNHISSLINGLSPLTENSSMGMVPILGGVAVPAGTAAVTNAGVAGFANTLCNSLSRTVCNADGGYFEGRCLANLSACWGINPLCQDVVGLTGHHIICIEVDMNVSGTPTFLKGVYLLGGGSGVIPATATGFEIGTTYTLPNGFVCDRGSCTTGLVLNDALKTNPSASQNAAFISHDGGGVQHTSSISADSSGNLVLQPDTGKVTLPNTNAYSLTTAGGTVDPIMTMDASANVTVQGDPTTKAVFLKSAPSVLNMLLTGTGMCNDTAGAQLCKHKRITTGSIGATTRAEVLLTWGTTFADANYSVACSVEDSTTAAGTQGLTGERVRTHSASQVGYVINNPTGGGVTGTLDCWALHD